MQEMKGKEDLRDLEGWEAKRGLASSGRGLDTSGKTVFLLLTGYRHHYDTLHVFIGKRGRTCVENVPLLSTRSSNYLS